ncbi:SRPBCC family protein [Dactylosporangium aurantiacum]|uniref:SRPBCC family protein n=1 Tax=Dactylosporangium aurantiacum TaxID=35754 RepID=A0A9Q9MEG8_9ACTN|nr:SRPBCC family protein [Dactylosporangium aurantiacum]MDG6107118.1 SRPBCC family protein [Dactylosporangium aurantiacum]UWZ51415.1 SRPBCC family protein [Dactylosporangium aurantiacum]
MTRDAHDGGIGAKLSRLLVDETQNLAGAVGRRALSKVQDRVGDVTGRLNSYAEQSGNPALVAAAKGAEQLSEGGSPMKAMAKGGLAGGLAKLKKAFGGGRSATRKLKVTNIVEWADVGVPIKIAYNQWTSFEEIPKFTKKVEKVERGDEDQKLQWRAQIFLSHRDWESNIVLQVPDERIVWRSKGAKGYVNGAVSFHALTPTLTRIVLILEYYPKGLFERTGNLWRAQGRRARLEFKHYVRHTMTQTILNPDEVEGWRGEIRDGEVVVDHDTAMEQEREREQQRDESGESAESAEEEPSAEEEEPSSEEEEEAEEPDASAEEGEEDEEEPPPARRRPRATPRRARPDTESRDRDRRAPERGGDRRKRSTARG